MLDLSPSQRGCSEVSFILCILLGLKEGGGKKPCQKQGGEYSLQQMPGFVRGVQTTLCSTARLHAANSATFPFERWPQHPFAEQDAAEGFHLLPALEMA